MSKSLKEQEQQTLAERMNARCLPDNLPDLIQAINQKAQSDTQLLQHGMTVLQGLNEKPSIDSAMHLSCVTRMYFGGDPNAFDFEALDSANRMLHSVDDIHRAIEARPDILEFMKRHSRRP